MQLPVEVTAVVSDLTRVVVLGLTGMNLWFVRGAFQDLRDLRNDVHGKDGISQRLARIEGAREAEQ